MEIRDVATDDLDALWDLSDRAFGPIPRSERERAKAPVLEAIDDGRVLGCYDGGRLVGSGRYLPMEQWWHGAAVPMGGVASVYVTPEERGRGVGARLAGELVELIAKRGMPLSMLYPATAPVYRRVGFEHAGGQYWITLPAEALRTLGAGPVKVRRAGPDDAAEVVEVLARAHRTARDSGPFDRGIGHTRHILSAPDTYAYLAEDGFLHYRWNGDATGLVVDRAVAASAETARALWSVVGSGSSTARTVRACVSPYDPLLWQLRDRSEDDLCRRSWMLRVVDAPAAIAARGFPAHVATEIMIGVEDESRPGNAGTWLLSVSGGRGTLTRTDEPAAVRVPARGLAALFAGVPVATLRRSGLLEGGDEATDLTAAFTATAFAVDEF
ncbi:GNAT family N-acetyltransferase [Actinomadura alba]|uniref:GNAT family N-acetyltransferase n=1 Tax=Actinomadura alba TaxID=406431 RepID=UPI0031DED5FF